MSESTYFEVKGEQTGDYFKIYCGNCGSTLEVEYLGLAWFYNKLTLAGKQLSDRYIQQMVGRYAHKAGINNKKISPHTLRHSYATQYYKQTKDIETLRRILGHTDIGTTTIYITLANTDVEKGMKSFKGFL